MTFAALAIGSSCRSRYSMTSGSANVPRSLRKSKIRSRIRGGMARCVIKDFGSNTTRGRECYSADRGFPARAPDSPADAAQADREPREGEDRGLERVPGRALRSRGRRRRGGGLLRRAAPGTDPQPEDPGHGAYRPPERTRDEHDP